jgi:hypothetical protein
VSFACFAEFCSPLLELDIRASPIQEFLDRHRVLLILFLEQLRKWRDNPDLAWVRGPFHYLQCAEDQRDLVEFA